MKLSIILPIYNGASTLAGTLESLANQTYQEFELVACIDGSTDDKTYMTLHVLYGKKE